MSQNRNHANACCIQVEQRINNLNIKLIFKVNSQVSIILILLRRGVTFLLDNQLQKYRCLQGYVYTQLIASPCCQCKLDLQRTIKYQLLQNRGGIHNQINQSLISVFLSQLTGIMVEQCKSLEQTFKLGTISSKSQFKIVSKMIRIQRLLNLNCRLQYILYPFCEKQKLQGPYSRSYSNEGI
ncbi:Hypothetical_protein [Hexamita inflata]|uniref:Hypothetical_protein n=1 Tax=Hexamita inflata TaxID=28002 RepID=A0AA86QM77_9EUKA|nr:Hypothetical protein HINF_LOCUS43314 [Hexamita inflata]